MDVKDSLSKIVDTIARVERQHVGWSSVTYKGLRYQVFGGVRTPLWIRLGREIRGRE